MLTSPSSTPTPASTTATVRMGGDALPRWWKLLANVIVNMLALFVLYEIALRTSADWETRRGTLAREALWELAESHGTLIGFVPAALLAGTVVLVLRLPRGWARRDVIIDSHGLTLVKHRNWWFPGRRGRIEWSEIQTVSAWRALFREGPGRGSRRVMRPVLDLYLHHRDTSDLPDWLSCGTVTRTHLEGLELPATRVRIGGPGTSMERSLRELAGALGRIRPEVFYQGTDAEQWFTPPRNRRFAAPEPLAEGDDSDTLPMERPAPPVPVWLCFTMPVVRWVAGMALFLAALGLAGYGLFTPLWQPWTTVVAATTVLALLPGLVSWVVFAPRKLARQGMGIDDEGIYLLREAMWWSRYRIWFGASWDHVLVAVARVIPAPGLLGRGRGAPVVDIYLSGPVPGNLGRRVQVTRHERPDGPGMASLAAFPATRLRLHYSPARERFGLRWGRGWRGRPQVRRLARHQIRPALRTFRPELCVGFDDVDLELASRSRLPWRTG